MPKDLTVKEQDKLIADEKAKLLSIFDEISQDKFELVQRLIDQASFMKITLNILQENIKSEGATYLMKQGSQRLFVENPAQKSYNTMINRYNACIDKMMAQLPKEEAKEVDDGFDDFINGGG